MAIIRELKEANLQEPFFPVEERPICVEQFFGGFKNIPGYKAIVDVESGTAISVVSRDYQLITNKDAYEIAIYLIPRLFQDKTISDFVPYNVRMVSSKGSCTIDLILPSVRTELFNNPNECFTPFIRISNSYNRTSRLKFEIGFCRFICLNGVIYDEIGFKFSVAHTKQQLGFRFDEIVEQGSKHLINVKSAWQQFELKLTKIREIQMPQSLILAMFCRAFDINIDSKKVSERQRETYANQVNKLISDGKEYFNELGNNGYAMFNVLTDFASHPPVNGFNINGYQRKVGEWLNDIVDAYDKKDFKLSEFIGEYLDAASYLESLIPTKQNN